MLGVLRSHLLKLATRSVRKAAARTREGVEAVESMLPHLREDLQRRQNEGDIGILHVKTQVLQGEGAMAEAVDTEDATAERKVRARVRDRSDSVCDLGPATRRQRYRETQSNSELVGPLSSYGG